MTNDHYEAIRRACGNERDEVTVKIQVRHLQAALRIFEEHENCEKDHEKEMADAAAGDQETWEAEMTDVEAGHAAQILKLQVRIGELEEVIAELEIL